MTEWELREDETLDDLQNGYYLIQTAKGFRFGADAVLLSHFAGIRVGERVADLGCGNGIIPILLCAGTPEISVSGLEIQEKSADLARRSVRGNRLEDRIRIITGDIREAVSIFGTASFDVVTSNPPYMISGHGRVSPEPETAIAKHEVCCTFEELTKSAAALLPSGGRFCLVHRPFRLPELFRTLQDQAMEPKRMRLVYPFADKSPSMVLIEAAKGGRPRLETEPPLIMYERPGVYTEETLRIYGI